MVWDVYVSPLCKPEIDLDDPLSPEDCPVSVSRAQAELELHRDGDRILTCKCAF